VAWSARLLTGRDDLRPLGPSSLHVTLVFLGWRYEREVERIAALAAGAVSGLPVPWLTPVEVRPVPPRRPRLFALDLTDEGGRADAVQAVLSDTLEQARLYRPERRPFWPHVTLARVKRGRRAGSLEAGALPAPFEARTVTLYRSTLRPQGAVYEPLGETQLGP
jgi:RNA 2',3'-cyclic 3'-phosphodiesterase